MEGNEQVVLMKKYKLLEKIGSGSFGSIYRCTSHSTKAKVWRTMSTMPPR
jgi:serine/threonine protein kinase